MKRQAGFTIIEMLIVVTILAMLAGILIPVLGDAAKSARDSRRATDLKSVQSALEAYKRANGVYPTTNGNWQGNSTADGTNLSSVMRFLVRRERISLSFSSTALIIAPQL